MQKIDIKSLVKPNVAKLKPYDAKRVRCDAKLDANESPYGFDLPAGLNKRLASNRYPDPTGRVLKKLLSLQLRVSDNDILLGNGSDELIMNLIMTFGGPVVAPAPTFSMYGIISQALGEEFVAVPLDDEFDLDIDKMLETIKEKNPKVIFLSSPNNPTGNCFSADRMLRIIEASKGIVVVDEAYQPFASVKGFLPLLKDYGNLVILRTLSKIGLAGIRVGYMMAGSEIVNEVNKVRLPFNVNSLSQSIAVAALRDRKQLDSFIEAIVEERDRLVEEMSKVKTIKVYPSEANFILFSVPEASKAYKSLLKYGVLVRNMKGVVNGCLRVTVGTKQENDMFLGALAKAVK